MTTLLKNGNVDVYIENGVICEYTGQSAERVIDCTGLMIIPGICDMHVHLRDPGQTHKEDLVSGTNAAAAGGVTAVLCMPNTSPPLDSPELIRDIAERSRVCKVKVYPCAAITKGLRGEELTDFAALKAAGAVAVSDDGMPVVSDELMAKAMIEAHKVGLAIISHCEPENEMTKRETELALKLDVPVHIAHVSTKTALECVQGKDNITFEIAPHHFTLTQDDIIDSDYKMNPPLRTAEDVQALINQLSTVNCQLSIVNCQLSIASDHAPHTPEEKSDFDSAPNGVLGLETILAVSLTKLYHENKIPLERIVEMLCVNPRRILGIPGGSLEVGQPADICVFDINEEWVVEPDKLKSKSRNTCFKGMKLKGRVKYTIVNGEVVYNGVR